MALTKGDKEFVSKTLSKAISKLATQEGLEAVEKKVDGLSGEVSQLRTSIDRFLTKYEPLREDVDLLSRKVDRLIEIQVRRGVISEEDLTLLNKPKKDG
jgi:uncharacterized protein YoxC